jgi:hypothetical protein
MKNFFISLAIILVASISAFSANPVKSKSQSASGTPIAESIPADIHKIFKKDCMGCHSKGGKMMAECHLNFSKWDKYSSEKKAKKAARIVVMLQKGKMPPKKARESKPAAIPTQADIAAISKWADSLKK